MMVLLVTNLREVKQMSNKMKDLINDSEKVTVKDKRLNDVMFIDFLWDKYQLDFKKIIIHEQLQDLADQIVDNTFVPGPDIKLVGIINGKEKVSYIKDGIQRRWAMLNKELRDIERKEKHGFVLNIKKKVK